MIEQSQIMYAEPVHDPLFVATTPNATGTCYLADNFANYIGCLDQYQVCNPDNGACTALTRAREVYDGMAGQLDLNYDQQIVANHTVWLLSLHQTTAIFGISRLQPLGTHTALSCMPRKSDSVEGLPRRGADVSRQVS